LTPAERVSGAEEALEAVRHAVEDFVGATTLSRAKSAIRTFLNEGRSVTWAISHLKSTMPTENWDEWWERVMVELNEDLICRCFYELRNPILHEGQPVEIHSAASMTGPLTLPPPDEVRPAGAMSYVLKGDLTPAWIMEDGSEVPAQPLRGVTIQRWNTLAGLPDELRQRPLPELMKHHIHVLERFLVAVRERFPATE
jgi:hypothetical protein